MNPTRILILGATGVDKKNVLQLLKEGQQEGIAPATDIKFYDFEQDFISHFIEEFYEYLDGKEQHQREYWSNAWDLFCGNISKETNVVLKQLTKKSAQVQSQMALQLEKGHVRSPKLEAAIQNIEDLR